MLEFVRKWHAKNKSPCKKCLVKAACQRTCEIKENFYKTNRKINRIDDCIEIVVIMICFFAGCLFVFVTFIFGIWKWVELASPITKWIFGLFK